MTWHKRLTEAREKAQLKKIEFAALLGVSTATTTDWENGETKKLMAENLLGICDVLKISPYWLMRGTEPELTNEIIELIDCYKKSNKDGKEFILKCARLEVSSKGEPDKN